ncbi:hypothetical protein WN48_01381 [Eufriesea mexicana]|uniref:Uncharacterized protein n=1 Tax=Eufriesea mexicana TaxID=516756 RepID=A0A310SUV8_9HYME|nr:hypothetical protein WN48_01381 [Eufriesea mexicana]
MAAEFTVHKRANSFIELDNRTSDLETLTRVGRKTRKHESPDSHSVNSSTLRRSGSLISSF